MLFLIVINAVLACALAAFLCIIWLLSNHIRRLGHTAVEGNRRLAARIEEMEALVRELAAEAAAQRALACTRVPAASLNVSQRGQVLAMHRRRESPESIAAALRIPKAEVELLLKVQGYLAPNSATGIRSRSSIPN